MKDKIKTNASAWKLCCQIVPQELGKGGKDITEIKKIVPLQVGNVNKMVYGRR